MADILRSPGYSLQQNQKMKQVGKESSDKEAQFKYINATAMQNLYAVELVISVTSLFPAKGRQPHMASTISITMKDM